MAESSALSPGITSLSEEYARSIALLDGDVTATVPTGVAKTGGGVGKKSPADDDTSNDDQQLTPIERAIAILTQLQTQISRNGLISSNETLDDVATSSLELLGVEYQLARAYLMLPTHSNVLQSETKNNVDTSRPSSSPSILRKRNVIRAVEYFHAFMKRLEQLGEDMLQEDTLKEYHSMLDLEDINSSNNNAVSASRSSTAMMTPSQIRETKIQRYQRKKAITATRQQLQSQSQRRTRLELSPEEAMEGHDYESLSRTINIETLRLYAEECLEELQSSNSELEMLDMAIKMESSSMVGMDARMNRGRIMPPPQAGMPPRYDNSASQQAKGPMKMTQVTQNPITGELEYTPQHISNGKIQPVNIPQQTILRQDISNTVFRPSWNQPTMTLAELGERERAEAIQRSETQTLAEAEAKFKPRRYDQLEKDGMEDNEELVEASAKLDRDWDDWKEENPRGSGNKMSERGDRNF